jgi:hypothetical protein
MSIPRQINVYLRFGAPARMLCIDGQRRRALFAPGATFCRIWWERNTYGTIWWRLIIVQAKAPRDLVQTVTGVAPGASILLSVHGKPRVKSVLRLLSRIERQGLVLTEVAPTYWQVVHNRLAGRGQVGYYGPERHAAETARGALL